MTDACCQTVSVRISGTSGEGRTPAVGVRQGCLLVPPCLASRAVQPINEIIDGLHSYLEIIDIEAHAGSQVQQLYLRELVYAHDICRMASNPEHLYKHQLTCPHILKFGRRQEQEQAHLIFTFGLTSTLISSSSPISLVYHFERLLHCISTAVGLRTLAQPLLNLSMYVIISNLFMNGLAE